MHRTARVSSAALVALASGLAFSSLSSAIRPAPRVSLHTEVLGVSTDRSTALVRVRSLQDRSYLPRYRRIEIASGRSLGEWTLDARDGLESSVFFGRTPANGVASVLATPAHRADVARYSAALAALSHHNDARFAVGAERVVFNVGDELWQAARDGTDARRIPNPGASYGPTISRDGRRVAYTSMVGRLDGVVGNYVLHLLDLRPRALPVRVAATRDVWYEDLSWSADSAYVFARMGAEHAEGGCFVRVLASRPYHLERLACVDRAERIDAIAYSPGARFAVVRGYRTIASGGNQQSLQWIDLGTGRVIATARHAGNLNSGAVNDRGVLLAQTDGQRALMLDPLRRSAKLSNESIPVPNLSFDAAWIDDDRYVVGENSSVRIIDLRQQRWTDRPWPSI
jgi:hypothetical protein